LQDPSDPFQSPSWAAVVRNPPYGLQFPNLGRHIVDLKTISTVRIRDSRLVAPDRAVKWEADSLTLATQNRARAMHKFNPSLSLFGHDPACDNISGWGARTRGSKNDISPQRAISIHLRECAFRWDRSCGSYGLRLLAPAPYSAVLGWTFERYRNDLPIRFAWGGILSESQSHLLKRASACAEALSFSEERLRPWPR
jgi:hypothetical protein